jgi:hypothetical protein
LFELDSVKDERAFYLDNKFICNSLVLYECHFVTKNITVNCLLLVIIYLTYITDVSWHGTNVIDEDGHDTFTELKIFI